MNEEMEGQLALFSLPEPAAPPSFDQATPETCGHGGALCSECGPASESSQAGEATRGGP